MVQRKEMFAKIWLNIYIIRNLKLLCSLYRRNDRIRLAKYGIIERNLQLIFTRIIEIFFRFFISRMNYSFFGDNTNITKERGFEYLYYKNLYYYLSKCVETIKFAKFVSSKPSSIYKHQISNARIIPGLSYSFYVQIKLLSRQEKMCHQTTPILVGWFHRDWIDLIGPPYVIFDYGV